MKTTYVMGAGASKDAGYPLARTMGSDLFAWMEKHEPIGIYDFQKTAKAIRDRFGTGDDIEILLTEIDEWTDQRALAADFRNTLTEALRQWFMEIRQRPATSYEHFAQKIVGKGDSILSFNYDVALDRQLKLAGLWELGDGYGFEVEGFKIGAQVHLLKLHGSINWLTGVPGMGRRPVFTDSELNFLGYDAARDPRFPPSGLPAVHPLILPTRCKKFYFETSFGRQWEGFWNHLWKLAASALDESQRVVICGYSLLAVDKRACDLLLSSKSTPSFFEVCCGTDSQDIVERLRIAGHDAHASDQRYFGDWVKHQINNQAGLKPARLP